MRFSIEAIAALALLSSQQEVRIVSGFTNVIHAGNLHASWNNIHMDNNVGVEVGKSSISGLRMLGKGWENDDFLNSLGGSDKDREEANDKYNEKKEHLSQFRERQAVSVVRDVSAWVYLFFVVVLLFLFYLCVLHVSHIYLSNISFGFWIE